jgi:ribonuclease HI
MGVGVVIRDATGRVLAARTKVTPHITEPASAEALAVWEAVVLAREVGGSRILLEGDSSVIVSALGAREPSLRVYGQILNDTKSMFSHFLSVEVHHVRRSANQVAHVLAKYGISQLLNNTWIDECPIIIHNAVVADYDCTT